MRYDKKFSLVKSESVEDVYGGISTSTDVKVGDLDCFIAPETTSHIDLKSGQKVIVGTTKIFTKAKINLGIEGKVDIIQVGYNRTKFNHIVGVKQIVKENTLKLIYLNNKYEISAITDLGKLTMIEVERYV